MLPRPDHPNTAGTSLRLRPEDEQSFTLYSTLAATFRSGAIAELFENTTRLLLLALGKEGLSDLVDRYVSATAPVPYPTEEALRFRRFLQANPLPVPGLDDLLQFEGALIESAVNNITVRVTLTRDIDSMLEDISAGRLPGLSSDRPPTVLEIGVDPGPFIRQVASAAS